MEAMPDGLQVAGCVVVVKDVVQNDEHDLQARAHFLSLFDEISHDGSLQLRSATRESCELLSSQRVADPESMSPSCFARHALKCKSTTHKHYSPGSSIRVVC